MAEDLDQSSLADKLQRKIPPDYSRTSTMASLSHRWQKTSKWIWLIACLLLSASNISKLQSNSGLKQFVTTQAFDREDFYYTSATEDTSMLHDIMSMLALNHSGRHGAGSGNDQSTHIADATDNDLPGNAANSIKCIQDQAPPLIMLRRVSENMPPTMVNREDVTTLLCDIVPTIFMCQMVGSGIDNDQCTTYAAINICGSNGMTDNDLITADDHGGDSNTTTDLDFIYDFGLGDDSNIIPVLPLDHTQYFSIFCHQFPFLYGNNKRCRQETTAAADICHGSAADTTGAMHRYCSYRNNSLLLLPVHQDLQYYNIFGHHLKAIQSAIAAHNCGRHNCCLIYDDGNLITSRHLFLYGNGWYSLAAAVGADTYHHHFTDVNVVAKACILQPMLALYSILDNESESLHNFTTNANIWGHRPPEINNCID